MLELGVLELGVLELGVLELGVLELGVVGPVLALPDDEVFLAVVEVVDRTVAGADVWDGPEGNWVVDATSPTELPTCWSAPGMEPESGTVLVAVVSPKAAPVWPLPTARSEVSSPAAPR